MTERVERVRELAEQRRRAHQVDVGEYTAQLAALAPQLAAALDRAEKVVEAAKGAVDRIGNGREVYIGTKHIMYDAAFKSDRDPITALRAAIKEYEEGGK